MRHSPDTYVFMFLYCPTPNQIQTLPPIPPLEFQSPLQSQPSDLDPAPLPNSQTDILTVHVSSNPPLPFQHSCSDKTPPHPTPAPPETGGYNKDHIPVT